MAPTRERAPERGLGRALDCAPERARERAQAPGTARRRVPLKRLEPPSGWELAPITARCTQAKVRRTARTTIEAPLESRRRSESVSESDGAPHAPAAGSGRALVPVPAPVPEPAQPSSSPPALGSAPTCGQDWANAGAIQADTTSHRPRAATPPHAGCRSQALPSQHRSCPVQLPPNSAPAQLRRTYSGPPPCVHW